MHRIANSEVAQDDALPRVRFHSGDGLRTAAHQRQNQRVCLTRDSVITRLPCLLSGLEKFKTAELTK
jgi:hypothetical protein